MVEFNNGNGEYTIFLRDYAEAKKVLNERFGKMRIVDSRKGGYYFKDGFYLRFYKEDKGWRVEISEISEIA